MRSITRFQQKTGIDTNIVQQQCIHSHPLQCPRFSATMSRTVEAIATSFLRSPIVITIGDESQAVNSDIEQIIRFVKPEQKMKRLEKVLSS